MAVGVFLFIFMSEKLFLVKTFQTSFYTSEVGFLGQFPGLLV
jgi:hypothetical protein